MDNKLILGIDFGTTNSAVALALPDRSTKLAQFRSGTGRTSVYRSVLCFETHERDSRRQMKASTGPLAIERYLQSFDDVRFMQSLKTFLTVTDSGNGYGNKEFGTDVFGKYFTISDLVGIFLKDLVSQSLESFGQEIECAVVGRPVTFAGADTPEKETLALERLRNACATAGLTNIEFEFEPVAAAFQYEQSLMKDEKIIVADFGGGTSDFCALQVGPKVRDRLISRERIIGVSGVGVAGDAFDGTIVDRVVAPLLGKGSAYRSLDPFSETKLTVPNWIYTKLSRWNALSFLKTPRTLRYLKELEQNSREPEKISALISLVVNDLGFSLYQSVEPAKVRISKASEAFIDFHEESISIQEALERDRFEGWIEGELQAIAEAIDDLVNQTGLKYSDFDHVFLTGGTAQTPAVQKIFKQRFGANRLTAGDYHTSVAQGLALRALEVERLS